MAIELVEGPWRAGAVEALNYRVKTSKAIYLCRITDLAIFDDYSLSYEDYSLESAFEAHLPDILWRTERLLPPVLPAAEGKPDLVIKRGNAMP